MSTWEERMTPRPKREPRLDLLETCWKMRGPSGRVLDCGIYRTDAGLEVRCGYGFEDLLYSRRVDDTKDGRFVAGELRQAVVAKGGFEDVPVQEAPDGRLG